MSQAAESMRLTARGCHRVLRVARTLADLVASEGARRIHIAEAVSYRRVMPGRRAPMVGLVGVRKSICHTYPSATL